MKLFFNGNFSIEFSFIYFSLKEVRLEKVILHFDFDKINRLDPDVIFSN